MARRQEGRTSVMGLVGNPSPVSREKKLLAEVRPLELVRLVRREPGVVEQLEDLRNKRRGARRQLLGVGSSSKARVYVAVNYRTRDPELVDAFSKPPSAREHRLEHHVVDRHHEARTPTSVGAIVLRSLARGISVAAKSGELGGAKVGLKQGSRRFPIPEVSP
jgi:hypothetical protein